MEKAVIGATKPKCMYPKQKYLDSLLFGATSSMNNIMLIMNALQPRMSSNTWTTSFKSLLVVHLLTRSDAGNDVLSYCASQRGILSAAYKGGANSGHSAAIRSYAAYLIEKVHVYGELQRDLVRTGVQGRDGYLRNLPLSKGLLHHVAALQKQIGALVSCKFYMDELSNEVTVGAFALLVQDLLRLFQAMNEGVINILQHYFEMTKDQARLGLQIYKTFAEQTTKVMDYFSVAKRMETVIHITIPQLKHAPLSLVRTLEEYLNSPDFEETQGKGKAKEVSSNKSTTKAPSSAKPSSPTNSNSNSGKHDADTWAPKKTAEESKRLSTRKDMIDFFSSIDNEETTIAQNPNMFQAQMMTGGDEFQQFQLQLQQQNQLLQMQQMQQMQEQQMLQNQMTGFGGQNFLPNMVAPQPTGFNTNPFTMQQQQQQQQQQASQNMFGGSSMNLLGGGVGNSSMGNMNSVLPQSTGNPFRTNSSIGSMSAHSVPQMTSPTHYNTMPSISSQPTGTNPFAPSANPLNPFSPNFGKVPAHPTGMMGMNNNTTTTNNNMGMGMGMGMNGGMVVNNNPTGANNLWGQQQQQQQSAFGHQASGSSFM